MAGDNINYPEPEDNKDHTYYGNGCDNKWDETAPHRGGSIVACSIKTVNTYGNTETQKIGTYYSYQALSSGAGSQITTNNTNSPDTFCPLGWQLPYSGRGGDYYDKSRSFKYLLSSYSIVSDPTTGSKMSAYPLDFIFSGYLAIGYTEARLYNATNTGLYASSTSEQLISYYNLHFTGGYLDDHSTNGRGASYPLRYVKFLASHHRRHGGRN